MNLQDLLLLTRAHTEATSSFSFRSISLSLRYLKQSVPKPKCANSINQIVILPRYVYQNVSMHSRSRNVTRKKTFLFDCLHTCSHQLTLFEFREYLGFCIYMYLSLSCVARFLSDLLTNKNTIEYYTLVFVPLHAGETERERKSETERNIFRKYV